MKRYLIKLAMNYDNSKLRKYTLDNRKQMTKAERLLWSKLRRKSFMNLRFRRQHVIDKYIVDFICTEKKLIIEINGGSHDESKYDYDLKRQRYLENLGFIVLNFTEFDVVRSVDDVMQTVENVVSGLYAPPSP